MKVIDILFEYLPEKYIDAIVNNLSDRSKLYEPASTFSSELMTLFDWHESREGYEFWDELLDCVLSGQELPPFPITINYAPNTTFVCKKTIVVLNAGGTNVNLAYEFNIKDISNYTKTKKEKVLCRLN